jgi:hypothetical protein
MGRLQTLFWQIHQSSKPIDESASHIRIAIDSTYYVKMLAGLAKYPQATR